MTLSKSMNFEPSVLSIFTGEWVSDLPNATTRNNTPVTCSQLDTSNSLEWYHIYYTIIYKLCWHLCKCLVIIVNKNKNCLILLSKFCSSATTWNNTSVTCSQLATCNSLEWYHNLFITLLADKLCWLLVLCKYLVPVIIINENNNC